jgi:hypothetical protein
VERRRAVNQPRVIPVSLDGRTAKNSVPEMR